MNKNHLHVALRNVLKAKDDVTLVTNKEARRALEHLTAAVEALLAQAGTSVAKETTHVPSQNKR